MIDDVASFRDGADRTAEKNEAGIGGAWNPTIKGIKDVDFWSEKIRLRILVIEVTFFF